MAQEVVRVEGIESLTALARDLKASGDKDLRRELFRGIQRAGKPLKAAAREAAATQLPQRGGLSTRVATSRFSVRTRLGRNPSIRVEGKGPDNSTGQSMDLKSMDRGRLRHPVYARGENRKRWRWTSQAISPNWFSDAMEATADREVRDEVIKAIEAVRDKLGGRQ